LQNYAGGYFADAESPNLGVEVWGNKEMNLVVPRALALTSATAKPDPSINARVAFGYTALSLRYG